MSCEWKLKIETYVDGELPAEDLAPCEAHLRECLACRQAVLSSLQIKQAIRSAAAGRYMPPAALRVAALGARRRRRLSWLPTLRPITAAALVLLVIAAAIWLATPHGFDYAGELVDLHVTALAGSNPVDVLSSDRHTVKPWFQGRLPFSFDLPNLQGTPFRLIGGRVSYVQQNPAAQLLFGIRKHQISVFIFDDRGQGRFRPETQELGFSIDTWRQGRLAYAAIGDTGPQDLHALRQLLRASASNGR
jgi:anti-sigma factor RsiW